MTSEDSDAEKCYCANGGREENENEKIKHCNVKMKAKNEEERLADEEIKTESREDYVSVANEQKEETRHRGRKEKERDEEKGRKDEERHDEEYDLPDGGWGWVVVIGAAVILVMVDTIGQCFGIIFSTFLLELRTSSVVTAWIFNLFGFTWCLTGPPLGPLLAEFGWRKVTMIAAILLSLSTIASAFVTASWMLFLTYSLFAGIACGVLSNVSYLIVPHYFHKRRGIASGLVMMWDGGGQFLGPPIISHLQDHYGFSGATLILGGVMLNCCVSAMTYHPVEWHRKRHPSQQGHETGCRKSVRTLQRHLGNLLGLVHLQHHKKSMDNLQQHQDSIDNLQHQSHEHQEDPQHHQQVQNPQHQNHHQHQQDHQHQKHQYHQDHEHQNPERLRDHQHQQNHEYLQDHQHQNHHHQNQQDQENHQHQQNHEYLQDHQHQNHHHQNQQDQENQHYRRTDDEDTDDPIKSDPHHARQRLGRIFYSTLTDLKILMWWRAVVIAVGNTFMFCGYLHFLAFVPFAMQESGFTLEESAWCVSLSGVTNMATRVLVASLSDASWFSFHKCYLFGSFTITVTIIVFTMVEQWVWMAVVMGVWGCGVGAFMGTFNLVMVHYMGLHNFTSMLGGSMLTIAAGYVTIGPFIGYIRDTSGSYDVTMYALASVVCCSFLLWLFMPLAVATDERRKERMARRGTQVNTSVNT